MERNEEPEATFQSLMNMCRAALEDVPVPKSSAGLIEAMRRLDELGSALATVTIRLEVGFILSRAPLYTSGMGTSPMAAEAADRLRVAINNVLALRET